MTRVLAVLFATLLVAVACSESSESKGSTGSGTDASDTDNGAGPDVDLILSADGSELLATVDERFQSYNVEMIEVTGGSFWAPYDTGSNQEVRPPVDLSSERLRNLARELGPAYLRVSGTAANSTYFDADGSTGGLPPEGFNTVLTTDQWEGVGAFADAVDAEILTSFASSPGTRDEAGVWQPEVARSFLEYNRDNGISLAAAEFYNEPSLNLGVTGVYDAKAFGRDFATFQAIATEVLPSMQIVGPGAVDDETPLIGTAPVIAAEDMLEQVSPAFEAFSYHFYPKVSERCSSDEGPETALTQEFLSRVEADSSFYEGLRDTYEPAIPMWVTETAQAACGGDRWASRYIDVFRYLDEMGRLASGDGDVVLHNTLAASDYGLINEEDFDPRPNYWAAVLWQRLMGDRSLTPGIESPEEDLAVYVHCAAGSLDGGVTYLVLNLSETESREIATSASTADLYLLTSDDLLSGEIALGGDVMVPADDGTLPDLEPQSLDGSATVPPTSVAFVVDAEAGADACL